MNDDDLFPGGFVQLNGPSNERGPPMSQGPPHGPSQGPQEAPPQIRQQGFPGAMPRPPQAHAGAGAVAAGPVPHVPSQASPSHPQGGRHPFSGGVATRGPVRPHTLPKARPARERRDLRYEFRTPENCRELLTTYHVFRFERVADGRRGRYDAEGERKDDPTWMDAWRTEVRDMTHKETVREIRRLSRASETLAEKRKGLSSNQKRQIEDTLEELQRDDPDPARYEITLVQLDDTRRELTEKEYQEHQEYQVRKHGRSKTTTFVPSANGLGKRKKKKLKRTSITAYYKRSPRPEADAEQMLKEKEEAELGTRPTSKFAQPPLVHQHHRQAVDARGFSQNTMPAQGPAPASVNRGQQPYPPRPDQEYHTAGQQHQGPYAPNQGLPYRGPVHPAHPSHGPAHTAQAHGPQHPQMPFGPVAGLPHQAGPSGQPPQPPQPPPMPGRDPRSTGGQVPVPGAVRVQPGAHRDGFVGVGGGRRDSHGDDGRRRSRSRGGNRQRRRSRRRHHRSDRSSSEGSGSSSWDTYSENDDDLDEDDDEVQDYESSVPTSFTSSVGGNSDHRPRPRPERTRSSPRRHAEGRKYYGRSGRRHSRDGSTAYPFMAGNHAGQPHVPQQPTVHPQPPQHPLMAQPPFVQQAQVLPQMPQLVPVNPTGPAPIIVQQPVVPPPPPPPPPPRVPNLVPAEEVEEAFNLGKMEGKAEGREQALGRLVEETVAATAARQQQRYYGNHHHRHSAPTTTMTTTATSPGLRHVEAVEVQTQRRLDQMERELERMRLGEQRRERSIGRDFGQRERQRRLGFRDEEDEADREDARRWRQVEAMLRRGDAEERERERALPNGDGRRSPVRPWAAGADPRDGFARTSAHRGAGGLDSREPSPIRTGGNPFLPRHAARRRQAPAYRDDRDYY